jgi:ribosomal-protein-alanine N-acetyltransferase
MITPRTAAQLFALARDPELSRHLQWSAHETIDDSLEYVHDTRTLWERGRAWLPGIFDHERAQLVGCIGLSSIDRPNRRAEVGTWIGIPFQHTGINLHAKAAVATVAFELLDIDRLEFLCRVDNEASIHAMRRLPGSREEGVLAERIRCDDHAHDAVLFALLKTGFDPAAYPAVEIL